MLKKDIEKDNDVNKNIHKIFDDFDFNKIDRLFVENILFTYLNNKEYKDNNGQLFKNVADLFYDREKYLDNQVNAFLWGLKLLPQMNNQISWPFIHHLHFLATNDLHHVSGVKIEHHIRNHEIKLWFNQIYSLFDGAGKKASTAGIREFEVPFSKSEFKPSFFIDNHAEITGIEQKVSTEQAEDFFKKQNEELVKYKNKINSILKKYKVNLASNFQNSDDLHKNLNLNNARNEIFQLSKYFKYEVGYQIKNSNPIEIKKQAEEFIDDYNKKITELKNSNDSKEINDKKIILCIILLVKRLLNLHTKSDGNGRLCTHQILNLLLVANNFIPTLLDNNCLDAYSNEEIYKKVIDGMEKFKDLKSSAKKSLRNPSTLFKKDKKNEDNEDIISINKNEKNKYKKQYNEKIIPTALSLHIIKGETEQAKEEIKNCDSLSIEEFNLFISYKDSTIDWLLPNINKKDFFINVFEGNNNEEKIFNSMLEESFKQGNEGLTLSIINYYLKNKKKITSKILWENISMCNFKIFELMKNEIDFTSKGIHRWIAACFELISDNKISDYFLSIIENVKNSIERSEKCLEKSLYSSEDFPFLMERLLYEATTYHSINTIEKIIALSNEDNLLSSDKNSNLLSSDKNSNDEDDSSEPEESEKITPSNIKKRTIEKIKQRSDFSLEEKISLIKKIDKEEKLDDLLTDFYDVIPKIDTQVEKNPLSNFNK